MGTLAEKLTYLAQTKAQIRQAIIDKGVEIPENTPFRDYARQIGCISAGDGVRISGAADQFPMQGLLQIRSTAILQ